MHSPAKAQRLFDRTELRLEQYRMLLGNSPDDKEITHKAAALERAITKLRRLNGNAEDLLHHSAPNGHDTYGTVSLPG
jgi:hypothetical protein